jgi:hypothetical protein
MFTSRAEMWAICASMQPPAAVSRSSLERRVSFEMSSRTLNVSSGLPSSSATA